MNPIAALRPRRSPVLPLLTALFPVLYFVYREASAACVWGRNCPDPTYAGYALLGIAVSYLLACAALAPVGVRVLAADHPAVRLALRPGDATLAVLGVLVVAVAGYVVATLVTAIPSWLDLLLTPFGFVVGLPFVAITAAMMVVGSALSVEPSMPVQLAVVAASLAVTGAWVFLLTTGVAGVVAGEPSVGTDAG